MTAQVPEILFYKGNRLDLCAQPLSGYLRKRPESRRPEFMWRSTACWRGYVGTWRIDEGRLFLLDLQGVIRTEAGPVEARLATAMPWLRPPVPATWYTGELRCPEGRLLDYVHAGYASLYERDRIFHVEKGEIVAEWLRINPPPPLVYRIAPDGTRVRKAWMAEMAYELEDPFAPDEMPVGHKIWGIPPEDRDADEEDGSRDDGYVIGGALIRPLKSDPA